VQIDIVNFGYGLQIGLIIGLLAYGIGKLINLIENIC
jgi:hypothetical protein